MSERSATPLERAVDAASACLLAWAYPSDAHVRATAIATCGAAGFDYLATLADATARLDGIHYNPANADNARYEIARTLLNIADQLRAKVPVRHGVLTSGLSLDGTALIDPDTDDYEGI